MAFLFKSKKDRGLPPGARDIHSSGGPGRRDAEKDKDQTPTPTSSVNNSLNSLADHQTPSPDQKLREKGDFDTPTARASPAANSPAGNASLYPWSQRRLAFPAGHAQPFPRYGAAVNAQASKDGDVYLMGGLINGSTVKGDLWMVDSSTGDLACYPIPTTSEGPGPRVGHASLLVGNAFIVFGGDTKLDDRDVLDDTLYLLNTSTRQWSRASPPGKRPAGRYGHTLNILGSKIYVFGGQVEGYFFNDLIAFDLNALSTPTTRWETLIDNSQDGGPPIGQIPPARTNHTIVTWGEKLYLFGGTDGVHWFNDVWSYDPRTNTWSLMDCIGYIPAPREGHAAALVGNVMYIFGGRDETGSDLGDLAAFRITSRRWYTFQNMGPTPSPRSGHSMTAFNKQIFVIGGEPSSAPRDVSELSLLYILDTGKIRYPTDQNAQQSAGAGTRRPSGEKPPNQQSRLGGSRDGGMVPDANRRGPPVRESIAGTPTLRNAETNGAAGAGSRLPRASMAQGASGPPPQQQAAPPPRGNGQYSSMAPRSKTPTRADKGFGPQVEIVRSASLEKENTSPVTRESPTTRDGPLTNGVVNGRRTPTQQKPLRLRDMESRSESPAINGVKSRSTSRQARQQGSLESDIEREPKAPMMDPVVPLERAPSPVMEVQHPAALVPAALVPAATPPSQPDPELLKELEKVRSQNAWYASELALARKSGYHHRDSSKAAILDEKDSSFGDEDRPLVEALLTMRSELERMQGSIETQAVQTAERIAAMEKQRDAAINEAVYAKAKLAAHGGGKGTPQLDRATPDSVGLDSDRSENIGKRLATSLALQQELKSKHEQLIAELQSEKQARQLADEMAGAADQRISELELYKQKYSSELESLRAQLHDAEKVVREETARRAEAEAMSKLSTVDKDELTKKHEETLTSLRESTEALGAIRAAIAASNDKGSLLERKLEEEKDQRDLLERKLAQLRAEHEESTSELESVTRRLRDAEELAEAHAAEARKHQDVIIAGLDRSTERDLDTLNTGVQDERVAILQQQMATANELVRNSQLAANAASDKLRHAEERIAGLEAYQEQSSREGLSVRKQLQTAMREVQVLSAENTQLKQQLAAHQLEANAIAVQHTALKDLLGERGISAAELRRSRSNSPGSRFGSPEQAKLKELELQLESSMKAHEDTKMTFEMREKEADQAYREKLEQLENDYQSAVHYVKGTEKMLKRMKEELSKYKTQNARLQSDLDDAKKSIPRQQETPPPQWEEERLSLRREITDLQDRIDTSVTQLERQMTDVRKQLQQAEEERDQYRDDSAKSHSNFEALAQRAQQELSLLKQENVHLEQRAQDAEHKVAMLLEQVETSVDNYRRASQLQRGSQTSDSTVNGGGGGDPLTHQRTGSGTSDSTKSESVYAPDVRSSVALDSLATELDALRSHWETTNKNYRLSDKFDFERTPTTPGAPELSEWRKRLDLEENEAEKERNGSVGGQTEEAPGGVI